MPPTRRCSSATSRDQAHLYRLIDQALDFGIELLVVEQTEISGGSEASGSQADRPYGQARPLFARHMSAAPLPLYCRRRLQSLTGSVWLVGHAAPGPHRPLAGICCCGGAVGG